MTREELKAIMAIAFSEYDLTVTQPRFDAWWMHCERVSIDVARKALNMLTLKKTYGAPKISDFMECVTEAQKALDPKNKLTESEAWGLLNSAVQRFGWCAETDALAYLRQKSTLVAEVAKNFGWQNICRWELANETANRSQFWKSLASLQTRSEKYRQLGITETQTGIEYKANPKVTSLITEVASKMGSKLTQ